MVDNDSETEDEAESDKGTSSPENRPAKVVWEVLTAGPSPESQEFVSRTSDNSYEEQDDGEDGDDDDTAEDVEGGPLEDGDEDGDEDGADEWENDDDPGYVIVTLTEEEFIELEMVCMTVTFSEYNSLPDLILREIVFRIPAGLFLDMITTTTARKTAMTTTMKSKIPKIVCLKKMSQTP